MFMLRAVGARYYNKSVSKNFRLFFEFVGNLAQEIELKLGPHTIFLYNHVRSSCFG